MIKTKKIIINFHNFYLYIVELKIWNAVSLSSYGVMCPDPLIVTNYNPLL